MINGIDVSHHNTINWTEIRDLNLSQNLYFAFVKASEGRTNPDQKFTEHRQGSVGAGLLIGAYHFFLPTVEAVQQVEAFVAQVGALAPGELPPVVDLEWTRIVNRQGVVQRKELWEDLAAAKRIEVIHAYLDAVEQRLGVKPIIYTAVAFWKEFISGPNPAASYAAFVNYPLWVVNLKGNLTVPPPWKVATFVQNAFGENASADSSAFEKLDHDFFNDTLFGLLSCMTKGHVFDKDNTPVSAIIRDFQQVLKNKGFYQDKLDGDFGPHTAQAVQDFQQSINIPATGAIDEITWRLLLS